MTDITLLQLRLTDDDRARLDQYRRRQDHPPTRPRAVLNIIREALPEDPTADVAVGRSMHAANFR